MNLGAVRRIDRLACWLVDHGHTRSAVALWRMCRLW
jgi:hypothetical protein